MKDELRAKEALAMLVTELAFAFDNHQKKSPEDVGQGWVKISLPLHPMYADAVSFQKGLSDGFLSVMVERRRHRDGASFPFGRWHLSISHNSYIRTSRNQNKPGRMPSWDELKEARYKFLPPGVNVALMFPPEDLYYNLHPTCLHLLEIPVSFAIDPNANGGGI